MYCRQGDPKANFLDTAPSELSCPTFSLCFLLSDLDSSMLLIQQKERSAMANQEHLKILQQGVDAWNEWRRENPEIKPDLSGADLRHADFSQPEIDPRRGTGKFLHGLILQKSRNMDPAGFGLDLHDADV